MRIAAGALSRLLTDVMDYFYDNNNISIMAVATRIQSGLSDGTDTTPDKIVIETRELN